MYIERHLSTILLTVLTAGMLKAKTPPTPLTCSVGQLKQVPSCKSQLGAQIEQLLPIDAKHLLFGLLFGELIKLCSITRRFQDCNQVIRETRCTAPVNWTEEVFHSKSPLVTVIELCSDVRLYETYATLSNCVKFNRQSFDDCYRQPVDLRGDPGDLPPSHSLTSVSPRCGLLQRIEKCVINQTRQRCSSKAEADLVRLLVKLGLWRHHERCQHRSRLGSWPGIQKKLDRSKFNRRGLNGVNSAMSSKSRQSVPLTLTTLCLLLYQG